MVKKLVRLEKGIKVPWRFGERGYTSGWDKRNIRKEYFKSFRATLKSKLNPQHVSQAINT